MARVAGVQPDFFSPSPEVYTTQPAQVLPEIQEDPVAELLGLLALLKGAAELPWADAAATMQQERRALTLARLAGPEGDSLVASIMEETERLLAAQDQAALQ